MVAIADKLGRPSIPTNYAVATTVKTARTAGVAVLETYDLSKFSLDTPVFFLTYKKVTDPTTGEVSVTNVTSWKALVNPDNNTLTNMTLAPGYVDGGNAIGDFVELIPTSYWGNQLVDFLFMGHNADGSFKKAQLKTDLGQDGNLVQVLDDLTTDNVLSGGIWSKLTGMNAAMTALAAYIDGNKNTIAAVASRSFTPSKDTYVDILRNTTTNVFTLVYTEVANGAAAPALAANSLRLAKVITSGAAVTNIVQTGVDSLGNKIRYTGAISGANAPGLWWEELARVTYDDTTPLANLDSGIFATKKYLKLIIVGQAAGGSYAFGVRFNNIATASYGDALIYGSGSTAGYSQTASRGEIRASTTVPSGGSFYFEAEIMNVLQLTKQFQGRATSDYGGGVSAAYSPDNQLFSGKWVNTTDQITSIQMVKLGGTSGYGQKTELIVLGHD